MSLDWRAGWRDPTPEEAEVLRRAEEGGAFASAGSNREVAEVAARLLGRAVRVEGVRWGRYPHGPTLYVWAVSVEP